MMIYLTKDLLMITVNKMSHNNSNNDKVKLILL